MTRGVVDKVLRRSVFVQTYLPLFACYVDTHSLSYNHSRQPTQPLVTVVPEAAITTRSRDYLNRCFTGVFLGAGKAAIAGA
jgi:hypothetical protein